MRWPVAQTVHSPPSRSCQITQLTSFPPSRFPPVGLSSPTRPSLLSPSLLPLSSVPVSITRRSSRMRSPAIRRSGSLAFLRRMFPSFHPVIFLTTIASGQHWRLVSREKFLPNLHRPDFWASFCPGVSPVLSAMPSQQVFMALSPSHHRHHQIIVLWRLGLHHLDRPSWCARRAHGVLHHLQRALDVRLHFLHTIDAIVHETTKVCESR